MAHRYGKVKKLTVAEVRDQLRRAGMAISRDAARSGGAGSGEYRVTFGKERFPGMTAEERESAAYYTMDLDDARRTGLTMASSRGPSGQVLDWAKGG